MGSCTPIDNRRQTRRFRAQHLAKIVLGPDAMIDCRLEDISTGGARIVLEGNLPLPTDFDIFIAAHQLQAHRARLCWRRDNSLGVSFTAPVDHSTEVRSLPRSEFERVLVEIERDEVPVRRLALHG